jgi:hypothetical protein
VRSIAYSSRTNVAWAAVAVAVGSVALYVSITITGASSSLQPVDETTLAGFDGVVAASESQADALANGVVTPAEHEAAIRAWLQCAERAGFSARIFTGEGLRPSLVSLE